MLTHLYLGVTILAVFATTVAIPDIKVTCGKDSVKVTWKVTPEFVPYAARFFLGTCMPSQLVVLPNEEGELHFEYQFAECKFKKQLKGKHLVYKNEMTFRPYARSKQPAAFVHPFVCTSKRPDEWVPAFLNPGSGVSEGHSGLLFHMALLDEQQTGIAKTNIISQGSFMSIWAAVEQKSHQPLLLLMEKCVAAPTAELQPDSYSYPIISNRGCLLEGMKGNAWFLPRYHSSALILYLQSFKLPVGDQVYIHCNLVAWDPDGLGESKKACNYIKESASWELLDDPSQSALCSCCQSRCTTRYRREVDWESHGFSHKSVLGPLIIVDPSDSKAPSMVQDTGDDYWV